MRDTVHAQNRFLCRVITARGKRLALQHGEVRPSKHGQGRMVYEITRAVVRARSDLEEYQGLCVVVAPGFRARTGRKSQARHVLTAFWDESERRSA